MLKSKQVRLILEGKAEYSEYLAKLEANTLDKPKSQNPSSMPSFGEGLNKHFYPKANRPEKASPELPSINTVQGMMQSGIFGITDKSRKK